MPAHRAATSRILALWAVLGLAAGAHAQTPVINEFMASNATTIADEDGDFSDWIELFNPGPAPYDLTGCFLSDDPGNPLRWEFPAAEIPAGGFLLVWASGKDRVGAGGELHTNFAISMDGEPLLLTAADFVNRLDETVPIALPADISYGRLPDGGPEWSLFGTPTPGAPNEEGQPPLAAPVLSVPPGLHQDAVMLALSAPDPLAEIRYTLDGSEPTPDSPLYTEPLALDARDGDPNTISLIPTNFVEAAAHHGWRAPRGEVFKINVVRARAFRTGHAPSAATTGSYVVDPDPAGRLHLPVISLATSPQNLFDDAIGIYVPGDTHEPGDEASGNYFQRGDQWERPVHVEFFDLQGRTVLAQDAGARIHGGYSRRFPQKSLRLISRSAYGPSSFAAALFDDLPHESYDTFLIRNGGNDWGLTGFRDLALQAMCRGMGFDTQAGRPAVHFVNGEYWGLANLRERYDRQYLARTHGVPADEVALLVENAVVEEGSPADRDDYLALRAFVGASDMDDPANLAHAAERMDLANFIAYNVAEIYLANYDWPGINIRYWRRTLPAPDPDAPGVQDGRWRWLMYDLDWPYAFAASDHNTLAHATAAASPEYWNPPWSTALLRGLLASGSFRNDFINAFADHLNSTFMPARLIGIIDAFADLYQPAVADWQDRWAVTHDWTGDVQTMRRFAAERPGHVRAHLIDHFALAGATDVTLAVNDPARGRLQIGRLVIDGDLPGLADPAAPYPWTGTYFQGVPITVTALPAPGHAFAAWLHDLDAGPELTLVPGADPTALTAFFTIDTDQPVAVHAWHFNDLPSVPLTRIESDHSARDIAAITYPGTGAGYLDSVDDGTELGAAPDTPAGQALRVRNPSNTRELILAVPTGGFENLDLSYAARRTENGAREHTIHCRLADGGPWQLVAANVAVAEDYQLYAHDLAAIEGAADNPDLVVRFTFGGENAGGETGNQRFDNLTLTGTMIAAPNLPPQVTGPIAAQLAYAGGGPLEFDLAEVFTDPEGDLLFFLAESSDPEVAAVTLAGSLLSIAPLAIGEASISVSGSDGYHDPVTQVFPIVVRPAPLSTTLHAGAPNPFSQSIRIGLRVGPGETGRLEVFDSRGRRVCDLGRFSAGDHEATWTGLDDGGRRCAGGVYFYRLTTEKGRWTGKMALVR